MFASGSHFRDVTSNDRRPGDDEGRLRGIRERRGRPTYANRHAGAEQLARLARLTARAVDDVAAGDTNRNGVCQIRRQFREPAFDVRAEDGEHRGWPPLADRAKPQSLPALDDGAGVIADFEIVDERLEVGGTFMGALDGAHLE